MIKIKPKVDNKVKFGRIKTLNSRHKLKHKPKLTLKARRWKSIEKLNCKSAEYTNIDGIDFFYRVFHHDLKNKNKLKDIINDINNENDDDEEKMITGQYLLKFTPILYRLTKKMIRENTKEYRKFQKETSNFDKKNFKNWWTVAHSSPFTNQGISKVLMDLRKFWAVFFSSFKNFKNFQQFERYVLGGNDKLSKDYTNYVKTLTKRGVPKFIDPQSFTSTHHDNNLKVFTDWSVFSELWRLSKPIFCSYRTLFIECSSGIKESEQCPFNNWENFNFKRLSEKHIDDINNYVGDLVMQNDEDSIVGFINTGLDWADNEMNTMFEEHNPTNRARLLGMAKDTAEKANHIHGVGGSTRHTHYTNPAHTSSREYLAEQKRADSSILTAHERLYGIEGIHSSDASTPGILKGRSYKQKEAQALQDTGN